MDRIVFENVSKRFLLTGGRQLLRGHLRNLVTRGKHEAFYALRDVSFRVREGESLAVLGSNGAGKSTLLNVVTRLCPPDAGRVTINGKLSALLDLGAGFHPDLTGIENLRLNASLFGMSRKKTEDLFDEIVEFSGVGEFITQPLRTYSAGMVMRLAFSIAVHIDPDILVVDEVFGVGDQAYRAKCIDRMLSFRRAGKTMVCVSHDLSTLNKMCDRAMWLDHGQVILIGKPDEVFAAYEGRAVSRA
jgi:ABC-type polysaccharide/polyol phosphate transport system ATPase subunit